MELPDSDKQEILSLQHQLLATVTNSWMAQAVYVAVELRLPDFLQENPATAAQLADLTGADSSSLFRLLRSLSALGICYQENDDRFFITPTGLLLTEDHPDTLRHWVIWWGTNLWQTWGHLLYSVKTGKSSREYLTNQKGFEHLENNPKQAKIFNHALAELTRMVAKDIVSSYDFSIYDNIADIGGGYGELLLTILKENSSCKGTLFDRPHAIKEAKNKFKDAGISSRCTFKEGDFFESVPQKADAYILKSVIHDWNDEKSLEILEICKKDMPKNSHLLLIEQILPDQFKENFIHKSLARSDLTMLIAHGAGERTEREFRKLLKKGGFQILEIIPAGITFSVIKSIPL